MANYSVPKNLNATGASIQDTAVVTQSAVFDFASLAANAAADTVDIMQIPIGAIVMGGVYEVLTADGSATNTIAVTAGGVSIRAAATGQNSTGAKTGVDAAPAVATTTDVTLTSAVAAAGTLKVRVSVVYSYPAKLFVTGPGFGDGSGVEDKGVTVSAE